VEKLIVSHGAKIGKSPYFPINMDDYFITGVSGASLDIIKATLNDVMGSFQSCQMWVKK